MSCPICHNDITDINKVVTECNHVFHFTCIYKNLKTNISTGEQCPLCRKSFNTPTKSFSLCPPGAIWRATNTNYTKFVSYASNS